MKRILACALAALAVADIFGQSVSYTETECYEIGRWQKDSALDDDVVSADSPVGSANNVVSENKASKDADFTPPYSCISLKTNLLYYGVLLPNIELEWLFNPHWSVALEGNLAAWGSYKRERSYRLTLIDAEGRWWFKTRGPWHGMYAGVIAGGGWYDFEKGTPGYHGWGLMTGLSFGYMWPVTRTLSLEAEIGAGFMHTRYKEYEPIENHHVYIRTKDLNYFGPIKLKFALSWRFMETFKRKNTGKAL